MTVIERIKSDLKYGAVQDIQIKALVEYYEAAEACRQSSKLIGPRFMEKFNQAKACLNRARAELEKEIP